MVSSVDDFLNLIRQHYDEADQSFISHAALRSAALHAKQTRASGEPYIIHPLQVAEILVELGMDAITIAAALLHDTLEDTILDRDSLREEFGKDVENLVFGVTKIEIVNDKRKNFAEAETIRKMLFAMVKDIRVILIKLADRLHNMRTLQYKTPERQRAIAQDTLDIYAALAARLGISWMKDELEDLALKFLQPEIYQQIKSFVSAKKDERANYLDRVCEAITGEAAKESIRVLVESRAKHFYSIYTKMKKRNKQLDEIFDLLGIRIICDSVYDCYVVLGLVHRLWMPIEGRFKDYIAMPKSNKYQSLHTTVMCYEGKLLEIQIHTKTMDETAEYGVAAHWMYKQESLGQVPRSNDLSLISRIQDMSQDSMASLDFLEDIKRELLKDSIYVFTPKGDVIQLPSGSTAIDFAYHIHTEVGNHAVGAKADGAIIPLRTPLKNTQVIEILTNPNGRPHVDWLRCVRTTGTRHKIRAWLNRHDETVIVDRNIVARRPQPDQATDARGQARKPPAGEGRDGADRPIDKTNPERILATESQASKVRVEGERNMMIRFASCCLPHVGDDIVGYVSRGRGIIVHRRDCRNLSAIPDLDSRSIDVEWETVSPHLTRILMVEGSPGIKLFSELDRILRRFNGILHEGKVNTDPLRGIQVGVFTIELERRDTLRRLVKALKQIDGILDIKDFAEGTDH